MKKYFTLAYPLVWCMFLCLAFLFAMITKFIWWEQM